MHERDGERESEKDRYVVDILKKRANKNRVKTRRERMNE